MNVAEIIAGEIQERGIKQKALAQKLGISKHRVFHLSNFNADATADEVILIFTNFNIRIRQRKNVPSKIKQKLKILEQLAHDKLFNDLDYNNYQQQFYTKLLDLIKELQVEKSINISQLSSLLNTNYATFLNSATGKSKMKGYHFVAILLHYGYIVVSSDKTIILDRLDFNDNLLSIKEIE